MSANILQLISTKTVVLSDDYKKPLSDSTIPPVSIPKAFPKTSPLSKFIASEVSTLTVKFKSIKPPHKFSVELKTVSSNTVYQLKEELIKHLNNDLDVSQLKFMVKSKVPSDSAILSELAKDDTLSVMVIVAKKVIGETVESTLESDQIESVVKLSIEPSTWNSIGDVLEKDLGKLNGEKALTKLQTLWNKY